MQVIAELKDVRQDKDAFQIVIADPVSGDTDRGPAGFVSLQVRIFRWKKVFEYDTV